jgi:hypothetical protein
MFMFDVIALLLRFLKGLTDRGVLIASMIRKCVVLFDWDICDILKRCFGPCDVLAMTILLAPLQATIRYEMIFRETCLWQRRA